jgi:membrane-associated PAP2 superfamily phosphatase
MPAMTLMALDKIDSTPLPQQREQNRLGSASPGLWIWLAGLALTLAWDASGADIRVMTWLGDAQGFVLRDHWWLSTIGHDGAKQLGVLVYLGIVWMAFRPMGIWRQMPRIQRLEIVVGITLSLLVVTAIKRVSMTSCPWELEAFGGVATYVSHWAWGVTDGGIGHCFPGGHASSALAFLTLSLPWMASTEHHHRRTGQKTLAAILVLGLVLGTIQTLRGAHYPSHTAWTALICAAVAWVNHRLFTGYRSWSQRHS